jgi:aldehyde dehydrogenase (NAD+)
MATVTSTGLLPEVATFLNSGPLEGVIAGQRVPSAHKEIFTTVDPGSGEKLADVYSMQADDVDRAVQAAAQAFAKSGWAELSPHERGAQLHRLADAVEQRKKIIAQIEALDAGKVLWQAEMDVQNFVDTTRYFVDLALHVQHRSTLAVARHEAWIVRHPWGPCGFIFPWNFPLLLAGWGIAPALAAGNTVVIKPAEDTPLSTIFLAGWPARSASLMGSSTWFPVSGKQQAPHSRRIPASRECRSRARPKSAS